MLTTLLKHVLLVMFPHNRAVTLHALMQITTGVLMLTHPHHVVKTGVTRDLDRNASGRIKNRTGVSKTKCQNQKSRINHHIVIQNL